MISWSKDELRKIAEADDLHEIDKSLKRLRTDYVDLYQIHRWDYQTPIEETVEALNDVVRAGKVRYIGASAMFAWQFQKALHVADKYGWTRFVSMQDHLNLIYREEEREMLPLCREEKIGVIPYSPLASGRLTRDWSSERTHRSETDQIAKSKYDATAETDRQVIRRVEEPQKSIVFHALISRLAGCYRSNQLLRLLSE
jgi:aryl-alcohol dehydrogenase-like predicted oxidoreductase